jgi:hypothetical protein
MGDKPARATYQLREVHMDPKAYRNDDDPSVVYVVVPGSFSALRINGKWKRSPGMTIGHIEDNYRLIDNPDEVARLFKAARTSTDRMFWVRNVFNRIFRRQEAEKANPKPPSREVYDYDEIENKAILKMFDRLRAERAAKEAEREAAAPKPPSPKTSDNVFDPDESSGRAMIAALKRRASEREAKDK